MTTIFERGSLDLLTDKIDHKDIEVTEYYSIVTIREPSFF